MDFKPLVAQRCHLVHPDFLAALLRVLVENLQDALRGSIPFFGRIRRPAFFQRPFYAAGEMLRAVAAFIEIPRVLPENWEFLPPALDFDESIGVILRTFGGQQPSRSAAFHQGWDAFPLCRNHG